METLIKIFGGDCLNVGMCKPKYARTAATPQQKSLRHQVYCIYVLLIVLIVHRKLPWIWYSPSHHQIFKIGCGL